MKRFSWNVGTLAVVIGAGLAFNTPTLEAKEGFSDKVQTSKDILKEFLQKEGAAKLSKVEFTPTDAQKAAIQSCGADPKGSFTMYKGLGADGALIGTVLVIDQAGKEGPLQLLMGVKPDGSVYDIAFTVFGEERGKPALSWKYLKQFVGKKASDPIQLGKDVDGVSGASWTSKGVTHAVKKGLCVYQEASKGG